MDSITFRQLQRLTVKELKVPCYVTVKGIPKFIIEDVIQKIGGQGKKEEIPKVSPMVDESLETAKDFYERNKEELKKGKTVFEIPKPCKHGKVKELCKECITGK